MKPKKPNKEFPDTKKAKIPLLVRLTEMSRSVSTAESIRELSRKLGRNREGVGKDIKTKMSNVEIFNKPKAFEKI